MSKVNLNSMLYNIDIGNMEWYEKLSDEEKKSFSPFVSMRFASSVKGIRSLQEEYIENVNEFCNKDFSLLQKHEGDSLLFWKVFRKFIFSNSLLIFSFTLCGYFNFYFF